MAYYAFTGSKNENGEYLILRFLGIDYRLMAIGLAEAGADIIVVGNAIEKDEALIMEMASAVHSVPERVS